MSYMCVRNSYFFIQNIHTLNMFSLSSCGCFCGFVCGESLCAVSVCLWNMCDCVGKLGQRMKPSVRLHSFFIFVFETLNPELPGWPTSSPPEPGSTLSAVAQKTHPVLPSTYRCVPRFLPPSQFSFPEYNTTGIMQDVDFSPKGFFYFSFLCVFSLLDSTLVLALYDILLHAAPHVSQLLTDSHLASCQICGCLNEVVRNICVQGFVWI